MTVAGAHAAHPWLERCSASVPRRTTDGVTHRYGPVLCGATSPAPRVEVVVRPRLTDDKAELLDAATPWRRLARAPVDRRTRSVGELLQRLLPPRRPRGPRRALPGATCYGALASPLPARRHRARRAPPPVRVFTPTVADAGWSAAGHSVVEVVTDDMPFLVDSVTMELDRLGSTTCTSSSTRSSSSTATSPASSQAGRTARGATGRTSRTERRRSRESWMHVEIDRVTDDDEAAEIERRRSSGCCATSASRSRTGRRCTPRCSPIVDELEPRPAAAVDADELRQGRDFLSWLADDHFTFLGYREYQPRGGGRRRRVRPARRPRHRPRHPAPRPGHVGVVRQAARRW